MNQERVGKNLKIVYFAALAVMAFTGFGQMPIVKRYYINEIPGLGWAANFYTGLEVHYYAAMVLLFTLFYFGTWYLISRIKTARLTWSGSVRLGFLVLILGSGLILLLDNLPGISFSQNLLIVSDLIHVFGVMTFLIFALVCLIFRFKWLKPV